MISKKIIVLLAAIALSFPAYSQLLGVGGQYAHESNGQFFANAAWPTYYKKNSLKLFNMSGVDFTTSGGANMSGLQLKPIQLSSYLSDYIFYDSRFTLTVGADAGFLFDFRRNRNHTLVLTPNVYVDYKIFFLKAGYEIDTFHGNNQFFIRAGIGFVLGTMKNFR